MAQVYWKQFTRRSGERKFKIWIDSDGVESVEELPPSNSGDPPVLGSMITTKSGVEHYVEELPDEVMKRLAQK